ncbi:diguanylate cyclase domain-containing protein [Shewanella youngdeokensis]|uniref:diguanylate cyclase n=1 Tax=Shewanella youngdeokensis TaxID=2999068 RepID=A0ABZ0K404_9GAMM|nr:diguanylate cyclase [Shewanella sp. DAU334]
MKTLPLPVLLFATLVSAIISISIGMQFYTKESRAIEVEFSQNVDDKARSLEQELMLNIEVLHALKGVFISSDSVSRQEFKQVAVSFMVRHRNIQALAWIPKISSSNRAAVEVSQQSFYPNFAFTEVATDTKLTAVSHRDTYFPVMYLEPYKGNESALGFDVASDSDLNQLLIRARDKGGPIASSGLELVKANNQKEVYFFLPVYQGEPFSVEQRQQQLMGFVGGIFRVEDMFYSAIQRTWVQGIYYTLEDITNSQHQVLYQNLPANSSHDLHSNEVTFSYQRPLTHFGEREWQLHAMPRDSYITERRTAFPFLVGVFGILATLAMATYIFYMERYYHLVDDQVKERTRDLNLAKKKLETLSMTDSLTSIGNRRFFDEAFQREWNLAVRNKTRLALLMIDIDNFKSYNDTYGHLAGDKCLMEVARAIAEALHRPSDVVARYGGEEFVVLLPYTRDCYSPALRCCSYVEALNIEHSSSPTSPYVTVSVGVASMTPTEEDDMQQFASVADMALYKAKEKGRNQVCFDAEDIKPKSV